VFEEGMVMGIEGREGEFRVGGVRLENMVLVTKDGAEIIDYTPRDHILEPVVPHLWSPISDVSGERTKTRSRKPRK
jgi:hypothetical protein